MFLTGEQADTLANIIEGAGDQFNTACDVKTSAQAGLRQAGIDGVEDAEMAAKARLLLAADDMVRTAAEVQRIASRVRETAEDGDIGIMLRCVSTIGDAYTAYRNAEDTFGGRHSDLLMLTLPF